MKKVFLILVPILFFPAYFSLSQTVELERIVVKKAGEEYSPGSRVSFSSRDLEGIPFFSLEEIVDYSSAVDLKKRFPFGVQQDFSLRGSVFEDASVTLAGIGVDDPQTGHFSLEIPLTSADLEEVEIFKNSQKINFIPKKPKKEGLLFASSFGEHALWEELFSFNFPLKEVKNRISAEHKTSSGGRQDTDFDIYNFSYHSLWEKDERELEFLFGSTKRDFGADAFYSAAYRKEEEHTAQQFFSLKGKARGEEFNWESNIHLRRHTDKYILNRDNPPAYTNFHTTYLYGMSNKLDFTGSAFLVFNLEREKVTSTNLNKHRRLRKGALFGLDEQRSGNFIYSLSGGFDYYGKWDYLENLHSRLGYLLNGNFSLRFSFDRIWRAPSFTELYYNSPSNRGNSSLDIQKTNNFELGLDYDYRAIRLSLSLFEREQSDTIDWVKNNNADPWDAKNIGKTKVRGFDFNSALNFKAGILRRLSLGYTYLDLNKSNPYNFSKYVFDYNRHKVITGAEINFKGFYLNLFGNFANPVNREKYTTIDLKLQKNISDFNISLEGINIFNEDYEEMAGIDGGGRWYKFTLTHKF